MATKDATMATRQRATAFAATATTLKGATACAGTAVETTNCAMMAAGESATVSVGAKRDATDESAEEESGYCDDEGWSPPTSTTASTFSSTDRDEEGDESPFLHLRAAKRLQPCGDSEQRERLAVRSFGRGVEIVIMIHGLAMSAKFWEDGVMRYFTENLLEKFTFICPDLLGHGKSVLPDEHRHTMDDQVKRILEDVVDRYGMTSFNMVGHSLGCVTCTKVAAARPSAIKSLTFLCPAYMEDVSSANQVFSELFFPANLVALNPRLGRPLIRLCNKVSKPVADFCTSLVATSDIPRSVFDDFLASHPETAYGSVDGLRDTRIEDDLRQLENFRVPIHIFHGGADMFIKSRQSRKLANRFKNVILWELPYANHQFPTSHAPLLAKMLENALLRGQRRRRHLSTS